MKKCMILWVFNCILFNHISIAQHFPDIRFSFLNKANGLPTNMVNVVLKDSRGLIWIGTADKGLVRYDGKKAKVYNSRYHKNPGIASDYVAYLCEDKQGWLWVGGFSGLYHFDPITEKTIAYRHNKQDTNSLASNYNPRAYVDSKGRVWISSIAGLQLLSADKKSFINYKIPAVSNPAWQKHAKEIVVLKEDAQHRIWAGSAYGLYLVDTISRFLKPYYTGEYKFATSILQETKNQLWVGFWHGGLKKFFPETGTFKHAYGTTETVTSMVEWRDFNKNKFLCFTKYNAFVLFDPVTEKYQTYSPDNNNPNAIKGLSITYIYQDKEERLWICTSEGINIIDQKQQYFRNYLLFSSTVKDTYGYPKALEIIPEGFLVSDWTTSLVYKFDKQWKLIGNGINIQPKPYSPVAIHNIMRDENGITWYGTDNGLIQQKANSYRRYVPLDKYPFKEWAFAARNILKRKDGNYWVRFRNRGVYILNEKNGRFGKSYRHQYKGTALCMEYNNKGDLWLGTEKGFYSYHPGLDSFVQIPISHPDNVIEEKYNILGQFVFDEDNICWIATYGGLVKYDVALKKVEFITDVLRNDEMPLYRIIKDKKGILWMLSDTEVIAYNTRENRFYYFSQASGLPADFQGDYGIFRFIDDSTIAVGSARFLTTFNSTALLEKEDTAGILFTDVTIDGRRVVVQQLKSGISTVIVNAGEKNINIHFALLNYAAFQQNKLYYRLSSDKPGEWVETPDGDITLLNLSAGKYLLEVKGNNTASVLNTAAGSISIQVQPYWYQSMLFKILFILALSALVYFFIRWRISSVRKAAGLKQKITETEMAALKAQMNPHFMFNCINSIDAFIQTNDKYNATLYLNKFARLIRNVLDSSKQNLVAFSKDIETLKLYIEMEELRSESKFSTTIEIDDELINNDYKVPPLIVQPFVENAIIHGLRNREGNKGVLSMSIVDSGDKIIYSITDNGIGRTAAASINTGKETSYGLQMSYERIKLFNREVAPSVQITDLYENGVAAGTRVQVFLNKA